MRAPYFKFSPASSILHLRGSVTHVVFLKLYAFRVVIVGNTVRQCSSFLPPSEDGPYQDLKATAISVPFF